MEKLRTPFQVYAVYYLLLGLTTITPSIAGAVFDYPVKDVGVLLVLSAAFLGIGVLAWVIAGDTKKYGGLASALVAVLIIAILFNLWAWFGGLFGARQLLVPIIIDVGLIAWIWSAKPKS